MNLNVAGDDDLGNRSEGNRGEIVSGLACKAGFNLRIMMTSMMQ